MEYPPSSQRPPPMRQYAAPSPASAAAPYTPDEMYGGYAEQPYDGGGYDDPGYGYQAGPAGPYGSSQAPRSMRPPGPPRPPPGRGYPGDRPPPQKRRGPPPVLLPASITRFPRFLPETLETDGVLPPRGLEKGMAAMDINGRPPPRPHTSNSRRPDMRPPPRGMPPVRGRGYPPGPGRPRPDRPDRGYTDPNGPFPGPPRSATMPLGQPPNMYPPQPAYPESDHAPSSMGEPMPPRPSTAGGMRPPRARPVNDIDPGLIIPPDPSNRVSYAPKEFLDSYFGSHEEEQDMPNFDAMPSNNMGPIDEMGLDTPPKPTAQTPTSPSSGSGGHYAPYTPDSSGPGTPLASSRSQPNLRGDAPNQFENAGFQFDIPQEPPAVPGMHQLDGSGYGYEQTSPYSPNGHSPYGQQTYHPEQPQSPPEQEQNPDALPHHPMPVPFRPGHDQAAKPAPVRQYNTAPTPAPARAPAAPQPMPPDGMAGPAPVTQEELQALQQKARSNPSDQKTQLLLAKKLAEAAVVLVAENSRLDTKTKAKTKEKYIQDAYKIVKKLVSSGYSEAQFFLADCYGEGLLGLEVDPKEAFSLYQSAAKQGHAQSAYRVAVCCEIGQEEGGGTKRDPFKAVQWYKRAASLGDTPAMYKMGMINLKGLLGQARSPREGVSWLKRAAERADAENPHALHELALMYQTASGNDVIIRDEQYACQLFHQAAELGYKFSQFRLGTAYEYGLMGCPVDNRTSIIWYTRAAAQGEHQSELALSGWYLTGSDGILQQNDTEAYLWARKAATAGLAKAEYAMGYFTEVGIGATANLEDAKRWYWRAAAQGFPKARERLEDLKKGGQRMQKTRLSRSAVNKQSDGDCIVM
ncbi:Tetratricopeptide-like helical [Penicillium argentinense]|uniref:Tetratricopeptide-like helical n=1 Tax=Penicillium argentinense TaxID=1131581 RepID=A0A9W9KLQ1_9EURO|nr:Tetratricopeptide-like helical [Penicillium argentinense]KAJ5110053.1 Tetratricopeptide-like helical [Penicillium argentinense]